MGLPYQVFIALRYLRSKKRHRLLSFNTATSLGGVALGVTVLLVVLSVMSGFHEDLQNKILGVNAHVVVMSMDRDIKDPGLVMRQSEKFPHVEASAPFIIGQVMVSHNKSAQGVILRGIDPKLEEGVTDLSEHMKDGSLEALAGHGDDKLPGIVIGSELSATLGVFVGDELRVLSPFGEVGPLGMLPRVKVFRVVGVFEVGMFEYDSNLVLTGLEPAQDFLNMKGVTGVQLKLDDIYAAREVADSISNSFGYPYYTRDWIDMNRNLFSALKLEKLMMFIILVLIILVAAFNIVSTLVMNVIEKEREISILKAMGASNGGIMLIFMLQGFLIGLVGTVVGLLGGYALCYVLNTYEIIKLPADVYYLSHLPVKMQLSDFVAVSLSAVVISFLATIYPAWQAARLDPVEPLRYE